MMFDYISYLLIFLHYPLIRALLYVLGNGHLLIKDLHVVELTLSWHLTPPQKSTLFRNPFSFSHHLYIYLYAMDFLHHPLFIY